MRQHSLQCQMSGSARYCRFCGEDIASNQQLQMSKKALEPTKPQSTPAIDKLKQRIEERKALHGENTPSNEYLMMEAIVELAQLIQETKKP